MPLNQPQQEFVRDCLEDYIDEFIEEKNSDKKTFTLQIQQLKQALSNTSVDSIDGFTLYNCLRNPEGYFLKLENRIIDKNEEPLTIAEVQLFMLPAITSGIIKKAKKLDVDITELWNSKKIIEQFRQGNNNNTPFKSKKARVEGGFNPWAFEDNEKIYSGSMYSEYPWIYAMVTTKIGPNFVLPDKIPIAKLVDDYGEPLVFNTDDEEDEFLREQFPKALEQSELFAAINALHYLTDEGIIERSDYIYFDIEDNDAMSVEDSDEEEQQDDERNDRTNDYKYHTLTFNALKLITHSYYLDLLKNKKIDLVYLNSLNDDQTESLLDPGIIQLLRLKILRIRKAANLSHAYRRVLSSTYYNELIINGSLSLRKILKLSPTQCTVLVHPAIINLIKQKKLTIELAKKIKPHLLPVLTHPFYFNLISQMPNPIPWGEICSIDKDTCQFLLKPGMTQFIAENDINFNTINRSLRFLLEKKYSIKLTEKLMAGETSLPELNQLLPSVISQIDSHLFFDTWLDSGLVKIKSMTNKGVNEIAINVYVKRLLSLYKNRVVTINDTADTLDNIQNELVLTAVLHGLNIDSFKESVIRFFILKLKIEFADKNDEVSIECSRQISLAELAEKQNKDLHENFWQKVLETLIRESQTLHSTTSSAAETWSSPLRRRANFLNLFGARQQTDRPNDLLKFASLCNANDDRRLILNT